MQKKTTRNQKHILSVANLLLQSLIHTRNVKCEGSTLKMELFSVRSPQVNDSFSHYMCRLSLQAVGRVYDVLLKNDKESFTFRLREEKQLFIQPSVTVHIMCLK